MGAERHICIIEWSPAVAQRRVARWLCSCSGRKQHRGGGRMMAVTGLREAAIGCLRATNRAERKQRHQQQTRRRRQESTERTAATNARDNGNNNNESNNESDNESGDENSKRRQGGRRRAQKERKEGGDAGRGRDADE
jgi:hypothetical protein